MCPIAFIIYGIKLSDGHFFTGNAVIQNHDKPLVLFDHISFYLFVSTFSIEPCQL